ncbi:MAG: radical SAM protein, partial [bacterium]
ESGGSASGVRGCVWKDGERVVMNPPRGFIDDLDSMPFPAWDKLEMKLYDTPLHVVGGPRVPVIGSRGCPYNCIYCGSPFMWQRKLRWRSPANVLAEMAEIIERYGIRQFHFWDDNMMLARDYIEGLCEGILGNDLSIRWTGLTRPSHVIGNADLMPLLKRSGCIGLEIGIESANPRTFEEIGKSEDLDQITKVAELHKRHGMYPMFTYMAFNPGETIYGYWLQARFIDKILGGLPVAEHFHQTKLPLYIGQFCTPHPGTGLYREASGKGVILAKGWGDYYHHQINFIPDSLLDDVPLKLKRRLDDACHALINYLLQVALWEDFNRARTERAQREELRRFKHFADAFYDMCCGARSVREIALDLAKRLRLSESESLRFAAFLTYLLAQMGLIRSATDEESAVIKERHIADLKDIPAALPPAEEQRWLDRLLEPVRQWFEVALNPEKR